MSGGAVAQLKVLSGLNSCDNLRLRRFLSPRDPVEQQRPKTMSGNAGHKHVKNLPPTCNYSPSISRLQGRREHMVNGEKSSLQPHFPPRARWGKDPIVVSHRKESSAVTRWSPSVSSSMRLCLEAFNLIGAELIIFFLFTVPGLHASSYCEGRMIV